MTIQPTISNTADMIDSRDVIERIEELNDLIDTAAEEGRGDFDLDDELEALKTLVEEAGGSPDWLHGETLIRDSYFGTYAQELAEDIGAVSSDRVVEIDLQRNASRSSFGQRGEGVFHTVFTSDSESRSLA